MLQVCSDPINLSISLNVLKAQGQTPTEYGDGAQLWPRGTLCLHFKVSLLDLSLGPGPKGSDPSPGGENGGTALKVLCSGT